jgi:hypothetical protein
MEIAFMQRHENYTRWRLAQQAARIRDLIYADCRAIENLTVAGPVDRIGYEQAMKLAYRPTKLGEQFSPQWATYWFQLRARVPQEWAGQRVDLLWSTYSEGTLWIDGRSVQGLNGGTATGGPMRCYSKKPAAGTRSSWPSRWRATACSARRAGRRMRATATCGWRGPIWRDSIAKRGSCITILRPCKRSKRSR